MAQPSTRPDTPLAATPEPQPVSSGFQSAPQIGRVPQQRVESKYEKTANNAIQQIDLLSKMKTASIAPQPNQQQ